jgi:hypothetical protein
MTPEGFDHASQYAAGLVMQSQVLARGGGVELSRDGQRWVVSNEPGERLAVSLKRAGVMRECGSQRTWQHLLHPEDQDTVRARTDGLNAQVERSRARCTVVVDVEHRNPGHSDAIERGLARCAVSVDVPDKRLLNVGVVQAAVLERLNHRRRTHLAKGRATAGFRERQYPCPDDPDQSAHRA